MPKPSNVAAAHDISARLHRQIDKVLDDLENLPIGPKERVAALYTISRIQVIFNALRKGQSDDRGSAVRKYASAFKKDATGGRARGRRPTIVAAPDDLDDPEDDDAVA